MGVLELVTFTLFLGAVPAHTIYRLVGAQV